MARRKFLTGQDMLRIIAGFEIENKKDFIFAGVAAWLLLRKVDEKDLQLYDSGLFEFRPAGYLRALRMMQYKDDARKWRMKHPRAFAYLAKAYREEERGEFLNRLIQGVETVAQFAGLL